jgi:hypothetical protein
MSLDVSLLPLRCTDSREDLVGMLMAWMDSLPPSSLGLRSIHCREDLYKIATLRQAIAESIPHKDSYDEALQRLDDMHAYFHYLLECEERGLKSATTKTIDAAQPEFLVLEWESALTGQIQAVSNSLEWDRAGLIWNFVVLEAYLATQQSLDNRASWSSAAQHLQNAASWLQYLPGNDRQSPASQHPFPFPDFSKTLVMLWQSLLVAQAQRCVYRSLSCAPRPNHTLLAKLAAASVSLYAAVESIVLDDEESATPSLTPFAGLVTGWADFARAWGMHMSSQAEFHQSQLSRERMQFGQELARLDVAYQYEAMCKEFMEQAPSDGLVELQSLVDQTLDDLKERIDQVQQEGHNQPVPTRGELIEIRGEKLINIDQPLSKLLKAKKTEPIFQNDNLPQGSDKRLYMEMFDLEMDKRLRQMTNLCEERTRQGRKIMADVNLPHALTAYRQERTESGLPEDLWQRVDLIQREQRVSRLKQELWELRDIADLTRSTYRTIASQLDFDLDSDRYFRKENPGFDGHDAEKVQGNFRESLANYDRLLASAKSGDDTLLKRLNHLDTNPKFKLLQFQKSQLDMLLSGSREGGQQAPPSIDTSQLSRMLAELSNLFNEREIMLNSLHESVKSFDLDASLQSEVGHIDGTDEIYKDAVFKILKNFDGPFHDLQVNIDKQEGLLRDVLAENEKFRIAREHNSSLHPGDSCIVMIEDAIVDIEELSGHLKEGKGFYNVILPKLEKVKQQVDDVSARLTVERLEYDDRAHRARQEEKDALMAHKLLTDNAAAGAPISCSNGETSEFDEKVATLVAMDFDPSKVVEALEKYNNNFDEALNDLLSS